MSDGREKSVEPDLVERELDASDWVAIRRALDTKRGLGWVHAVGLYREREMFRDEVLRLRLELGDRGEAGKPRENET